PAVSINGGYTSGGLPIGLQIVGKRHDDLGVLQVAQAWERMRPAQRAWPEPPLTPALSPQAGRGGAWGDGAPSPATAGEGGG
ncbi:MAG TPA: hypothetical protein VIO33_25330, partial [Burkholderiaceae bacterium]